MSEEHDEALSYFPQLCIKRSRGTYFADRNQMSICTKKTRTCTQHSYQEYLPSTVVMVYKQDVGETFLELLFMQEYVSGFDVMQRNEFPNNAFTILFKRFTSGFLQFGNIHAWYNYTFFLP